MKSRNDHVLKIFGAFIVTAVFTATCHAQRIGDFCRVKGQEQNTLHGLGLVVGLKGTGDSDAKPTSRALATMMHLMGNPIGQNTDQTDVLEEFKDAKNVALVFVTVTISPAGARQGDKLDCHVSAISAKSVAGGMLTLTSLLGPRPGDKRVYALAHGPIELENPNQPTTGKIHQGCQLELSFRHQFTKDNKITLVLNPSHAGLRMAQEIADQINNARSYLEASQESATELAKALDGVNVEVTIPEHLRDEPVQFVSLLLDQKIYPPTPQAVVVINKRTGAIFIGENVEIAPGAISHKNMTIETGDTPDRFVALDPANRSTKLQSLVDALNAIKVPTEDIIDIIQILDSSKALTGPVVFR